MRPRHSQTVRLIAIISCLFFATSFASDKSQSLEPIVAPMDTVGFEVVFRLKPDKLAEQGISWEETQEKVSHQRFENGRWETEVRGKTLDLDEVASIATRELRIAPFSAKMPDGRVLRLIPKLSRIANYRIAGQQFETMVREGLSQLPPGVDPAKATVLGGIPSPVGDVPFEWFPHPENPRMHLALSKGEPLENVAEVEILETKSMGLAIALCVVVAILLIFGAFLKLSRSSKAHLA